MMKDMNSDTHSWTVSLESLAILAFSGRLFFIIRAILAMGRYRSCDVVGCVVESEREWVKTRSRENNRDKEWLATSYFEEVSDQV